MRCVIGLLVVVCLAAMLSGCSALGDIAAIGSASSAGTATVSAGPDAPPAETVTDTSPERLTAGTDWLWASVTRLRAKLAAVAVDAPQAAAAAEQALDTARQLASDVAAAVAAGHAGDALTLWTKARAAIGTAAGMVQALTGAGATGV